MNFPGVWCEWQAGRRAQCWCLWAHVLLKHKWLSKSETRKHQAHWYIAWINKQGACCQTVGRWRGQLDWVSGPLAYPETIGTGKSWAGRGTDHALGLSSEWPAGLHSSQIFWTLGVEAAVPLQVPLWMGIELPKRSQVGPSAVHGWYLVREAGSAYTTTLTTQPIFLVHT